MADKIFPTQIPDGTPALEDKILFSKTSESGVTQDCDISALPFVNTTLHQRIGGAKVFTDSVNVETESAGVSINNITKYSSANFFDKGVLSFFRTRGTIATPTASADGDRLGQIRFGGYNGSSFFDIVGIEASQDGTKGNLFINTGTDGISGKVGINTGFVDPEYTLDVNGDINTSGVFKINGVPLSQGGHTIQNNEVSFTQRDKLNFTGGLTVYDNPTNGSTDVNLNIEPLPEYTIINPVVDRTLDESNTSLVELANIVGTLIEDIEGVIQGPKGEPGVEELFKYQIVRTVESDNLTITLKNYLGEDPSVSVPVKIQVGDVVRTITNSLSQTINAGGNWFNLGSAELVTKEVDLFTYIWYNTTSLSMQIGISRIPSGLFLSDFSGTGSNEKLLTDFIATSPSTTPATNIGRFNIILGAGNIWSVPTTSVIVNSPCYYTRWLEFVPTWSATGGLTFTSVTILSGLYRIINDGLQLNLSGYGTAGGTASYQINNTLPFKSSAFVLSGAGCVDNAISKSATVGISINTNIANMNKYDGSNWALGIVNFGENITYPI